MAEMETPTPGLAGAGAGIVTEQQRVPDTTPEHSRQDWRDLIKVHPAADLFPPMSDDELDTLGKDILQHGLRVRLVFLGDELADGRNRLAAVWRTFGQRRRERFMRRVLARERDCCAVLPDGTDPYDYVVSANLHRRHLTREKKDQLLDDVLKARPELSNRAVGKIVERDHKTVAARRAEAEARGEIPHVEKRTDTAGRQQPARKLSEHARELPRDKLEQFRAEAPKEADAPTTIDQLADRKDALRVLDETTRFLAQRRAEVLALPRSMRRARARAVLDALGLSVDDLIPESRVDEARG